MQTRIQKWGNGLALRLPKAFAAEAHLENGTVVEVSLADGKLVIVPLVEPVLTLDSLLAQVTEQNLHHEIDTRPAIGHEAW